MGFVEVVPEKQILERSDPDDANGDVFRRPNYVWNHVTSRKVIGRLGGKQINLTSHIKLPAPSPMRSA